MNSTSPSKSGTSCLSQGTSEQRQSSLSEIDPKCLNRDHETVDEEDSFLTVKFQKLVVNPNNSQTCPKHPCQKVLKSEKEVFQLKKTCKKSQSKSILRKSKLGESFRKFRNPSELTTAIQDSKEVITSENQKIFGRKFSLSLENFGNLSLLEEKGTEEGKEASEYSTESFKSFNGSGSKRKRATTPEMEEQVPHTLVSCGQQARLYSDVTADELAGYLEDTTFFPKRMSYMAEMMYT